MIAKQRKVPYSLDWSDLEIAFRDGSTGIESFLDLQRAEVVMLLDDDDDERATVLRHPERFVAIPQLSRAAAFAILQDFVASIGPSTQRQRLQKALQSASPYMDAVHLLRSMPVMQRRYERFEERAVLAQIRQWLAQLGIDSAPNNERAA